ncbi:MAG: cell division protein FtsQ/DivIB [Pseudomonadota bacterium]
MRKVAHQRGGKRGTARSKASSKTRRRGGTAARKKQTRRSGGHSTLDRNVLIAGVGFIVFALLGGAIVFGGSVGKGVSRQLDASLRTMAKGLGFEVRRITLKGAHDLSHDELLAVVGGAMGGSMLHLDLGSVQERVEDIGWVRHAAVARLYPDTLHISVRERSPVAVWQVGKTTRLIDQDGIVIRSIAPHAYSHLPMLTGQGAASQALEVLGALDTHKDLASMVLSIDRIGERRWNLRLRSDVEVFLPEEQPQSAIDLIARMHKAENILDQDLEYIDLRNVERVIVRRRPIDSAALDPGDTGSG